MQWILAFCACARRAVRRLCPPKIDYEMVFLNGCRLGNVPAVKAALRQGCGDLQAGFILACEHNQTTVVEFLISLEESNSGRIPVDWLNQGLKMAAKNSHISLAEILVRAGADPYIGIAQTKSPNLIALLYRFIHNDQTIK